jgi:5-methylcytosine-specific restriction protein A
MAFGDLTSRDAVRQAMTEYDEIGREQFLRKYGFGPARRYFLVHDGHRYDSKAIVGVAHGYQFPREGPLRPEDFSGGEKTVCAKLAELGFEVP